MIETDRLRLRFWKQSDIAHFVEMCADKEVMEFFPKTLNRSESEQVVSIIRGLMDKQGWGLWAVEVKQLNSFIGFVGLHIPTDNLPFNPCTEIAWRLSKHAWGKGYATEAARQALRFGFEQLDLDEIVSFTARINERSEAVMKKLGMIKTAQNFMHPDVNSNSPLCEHVLYKLSRDQWLSGLNDN